MWREGGVIKAFNGAGGTGRWQTNLFKNKKMKQPNISLKDRAELILQSIRDWQRENGPVSDFRIKRQLAVTRKFCKTVYPN